MYFDQSNFDIRCEWGTPGIHLVGSWADVLIIVDVLSFSTCVDVALSRGATIIPCRWKDDRAAQLAAQFNAELAGPRGTPAGYSLSPASMQKAVAGARIVLPSPNGSALTLQAAGLPTDLPETPGGDPRAHEPMVLTACFRNCRAVADFVATRWTAGQTRSIAIIPAGERWPDGSPRFAVEDIAATGALIAHLPGRKSPEALAAEGVWNAAKNDLPTYLASSASGRELIDRGFAEDVEIAGEINVSSIVPVFKYGMYAGAMAT